MAVPSEKASVRATVENQLRGISEKVREELGGRITERILTLGDWSVVQPLNLHVGFYNAMRYEVSLNKLAQTFLGWGWSLYFPRVLGKGKMDFIQVAHPESEDWIKSDRGMKEPAASSASVISPSELDIIFVPGLAYGLEGERVGRGAGYYDRYLGMASNALRLSVAYDVQLFQRIHQDPWDEAVDWIVTEERSCVSRHADRIKNARSFRILNLRKELQL